MKLTMQEQLMQLKQSMESNNKRNEKNNKKKETEERNKILKQIANNNKVYKITAILDAKSTDDEDPTVRIVGCNHIEIYIDGKTHVLGHAWLREDMIDGLVQQTFKIKKGQKFTLYVKVKEYTAKESTKNKNKYEFTNK